MRFGSKGVFTTRRPHSFDGYREETKYCNPGKHYYKEIADAPSHTHCRVHDDPVCHICVHIDKQAKDPDSDKAPF